jgi:hypothetical protein
MTLRTAIEVLRRERSDLADALASLLQVGDPRWDMELPEDMWNHDVFEDAEEEYRFLRSVIEDQLHGFA